MPRIIITESGKSPQPYRLKLERESTNIGRGSENDIRIEAGSASTNHCSIKRVPGGFILEDLDSTNGIKLDDTRYAIIDLTDGCVVQIGDDVDLEFTLTEEEIETLVSEKFEKRQRPMLPKSAPAKKEIEDELPEKPSNEDAPEENTDDPWEEDEDFSEEEQGGSNKAVLIIILIIIALGLGFAIRHFQDVILPGKADATEQTE